MKTAVLALVLLGFAGQAAAQADAERLRGAKALFFDRKYAEARQAWQTLLPGAKGADADTAAYWIARCSENLGEHERAFREFGDFLARRPADPALVEEARTSRVGLAAKLYKAGKKEQLPVLQQGLSDASKTVRYFAALQLGSLGPDVGRAAVPVLKKILQEEQDPDLVDRAKLMLLRLDPDSLSPVEPGVRKTLERRAEPRREASWVKVRIFKRGSTRPEVSINLPVALAEMVFKSLPDDARAELRRKGYDAENFWDKLKRLGPTEIIDIEGGEGERVQIWIE